MEGGKEKQDKKERDNKVDCREKSKNYRALRLASLLKYSYVFLEREDIYAQNDIFNLNHLHTTKKKHSKGNSCMTKITGHTIFI